MLGYCYLRLFFFFLAEGWLPLSPAFSVFLRVCCLSAHPWDLEKNGSSVCLPACILHPLLHSASLSGLLTAAVQLSFYALLTGFFWSQTVSEKRVYMHKQCHVRRSAGNKIKIHSSKSSWSTHFFFATNTSSPYHLYAKMWLKVCAIRPSSFPLCPVLLNEPKIYLIFWLSLNRIYKWYVEWGMHCVLNEDRRPAMHQLVRTFH